MSVSVLIVVTVLVPVLVTMLSGREMDWWWRIRMPTKDFRWMVRFKKRDMKDIMLVTVLIPVHVPVLVRVPMPCMLPSVSMSFGHVH